VQVHVLHPSSAIFVSPSSHGSSQAIFVQDQVPLESQ